MPKQTSVHALFWQENCLKLLDQRSLPLTIEFLDCHDAEDVARCIRQMVVRGAPAIGCAAAFGLALEATIHARAPYDAFKAAIESASARLLASRPTAVNLAWSLARIQKLVDQNVSHTPHDLAALITNEACKILEEDLQNNRTMGRLGAELMPAAGCIMTHCNTGSLATAGHGTALGVIRSAVESGRQLRVIANETRPFLQGARLTAWELMQDGIPVSIATDSMAGHLMAMGQVDAVIVGADRIASNGDTANKIGTYGLAVLAHRHGLPFYVAAPISTIDMHLADGSGIPIEERSGEEVTGFGGIQWAPPGVKALHPAFDVTPAGLITALITERGIVRNPDLAGLRSLFPEGAIS